MRQAAARSIERNATSAESACLLTRAALPRPEVDPCRRVQRGGRGRTPPGSPIVVNDRRRILFVTENVTLAQCVRLVTLACALDPERYEVHFACSDLPALPVAKHEFIQH